MNQPTSGSQSEHLLVKPENWQNWRLKSLNPQPLQRYTLPLPSKPHPIPSTKSRPQQQPTSARNGPILKIIKINQHNFCILLNNSLTLFTYVEENDRSIRKKSTFRTTSINVGLPANVQWIEGDGSDSIYVVSEVELLVLRIERSEGEEGEEIKVGEIFRKRIAGIKGLAFMISNLGKKLLLLTKQTVQTYLVSQTYELVSEMAIEFSAESSGWSDISKINGISIICENINTFYFLGTSIETKADVSAKLGRGSKTDPIEKKCEVLYITKFQINNGKVSARIFIIDHIFEIGIFERTKVFQVGNETFVLSLYEQIIVIRRNFSRFMVWDNITIVASKSNEKKGQLILSDKRIMVYTENGEIYAHELFFNFAKVKLQTPRIDSFRGNGNEEQILYDSLIFEYRDQAFMKILFYFKLTDIHLPNKRMMSTEQPQNQAGVKDVIAFQIMCIEQTEPTLKLKQLLQLNKNPEQVGAFLKRFNIDQLRFKKSQWQVSAKGQKQIETLLLEIGDNQYIQSQLTKILKQKPHDLQFLLAIEKKQIQRYRLMLASKCLRYNQQNQSLKRVSKQKPMGQCLISQLFLMRDIDEIKLSMQWLLESKMFEHKLHYSMNFMSFKEYDFIEIGKLRTASLREEIKLLGVKGFEKRLKYFLNSFKYLVLDDFKQILRFVVGDLNQSQLKVFFIKNFPFILPTYTQVQGEDRCKLWDDSFQLDENRIQTVELFKSEVKTQMTKLAASVPIDYFFLPLSKAFEIFDQVFDQFTKSDWFVLNSYKQHSLLRHNLQQLKGSFEELKQIGVVNTIVELMYERIAERKFSEVKVKQVIAAMRKQKYLSENFTNNIEVRLEVHDFLRKIVDMNKKQYYEFNLPEKPAFIIIKQPNYFELLIQNFPELIICDIRQIYEYKQPGLFIQKLQRYLLSPLPQLLKLIDFIDYLSDQKHDDVRYQIFQCICRLMQISDLQSTAYLIQKIISKSIIVRDNIFSDENPVEQAQLVLGYYFAPLFKHFNIKATYAELLVEIQAVSISQTPILSALIQAYYRSHLPSVPQPLTLPALEPIASKPLTLDLSQPLDFLSIALYMHFMLPHRLPRLQIFTHTLQVLFDLSLFDTVKQLLDGVNQFGLLFDDRMLVQQYGHYRMMNEFKHEVAIKSVFEKFVMEWVVGKYNALASNQLKSVINKDIESLPLEQSTKIHAKINEIFVAISTALKILNYYNFNQQVEKQISRISLFESIRKLSPELLLRLMHSLVIQAEKYTYVSGFVFLINILKLAKNTTIFNVGKKQQVLQLLNCFSNIHKQYSIVYGPKSQKKAQEVLLGQLCRFYCEFVVFLTDCGFPRPAGFVLMDLVNSTYFYRDVLYYYVARVADPSKVPAKALQKFVYEFMTVENPQQLKKILNYFLTGFDLLSTIPLSAYVSNIKSIFTFILNSNQLDEAFFFALRNPEIPIQEYEALAETIEVYRKDQLVALCLLLSFLTTTKEMIEGQNLPTYMLFKRRLTAMMKPTQRMEVIKDICIVMNSLEIENLKAKIREYEGKSKQKQRPNIKTNKNYQILKKYYQKYLVSQRLSSWLSISIEQVQPAAVRLQKYPEYSIDQFKPTQLYTKAFSSIPREDESKEIKQLRKKLFENDQKLKDIQVRNRQVFLQEIKPSITQAKMAAEKEKLSLIEKKKRKEEDFYLENRIKSEKQSERAEDSAADEHNQLDRINQQQQEKLQDVKKNYTSRVVQQTEILMAELRERRRKIREETTVTFGSQEERLVLNIAGSTHDIRQQPRNGTFSMVAKSGTPSAQPSPRQKQSKYFQDQSKRSIYLAREQLREKLDNIRDSTFRTTTINKMISDRKGEFYVPRWQNKIPMRLQNEIVFDERAELRTSNFLEKARNQLMIEAERQRFRKQQMQSEKKTTLKQLISKMQAINELQTAQTLQKLGSVQGNLKACGQIIRTLYVQVRQIRLFINICKDLLQINQTYCQFIQHKSLKVVEDSLRSKVPFAYKQLYPAQLFTSVQAASLREYYHIAYSMLRPNLIKLMQKSQTNINTLVMVIRFGFGSDPELPYKIYEDYTRALLDNYQDRAEEYTDERKLMLLCEKLRVNYGSMNPGTRRSKFGQLVHEVQAGDTRQKGDRGDGREKKRKLVRGLMQNLENKSSMASREGWEQFRLVLVKLEGELG